jgi:hypothetical protein
VDKQLKEVVEETLQARIDEMWEESERTVRECPSKLCSEFFLKLAQLYAAQHAVRML